MSEPIKILRVITRLNVGGPSRHVHTLMRGLDRDRFTQRLVTGVVPAGEREAPFAGDMDRTVLPDLRRPLQPLADLRAYRALRREITSSRPDIVHTHQGKAGLLARLAAAGRVPAVVHTYHGHTLAGYWSAVKGRVLLACERRAARGSTALIAQSPRQREDLAERLGAAAEGKWRLIAPGVDFDALGVRAEGASRLRSQLGIAGELVIAFVARLAPVKDPLAFLRILRRVVRRTDSPVVAVVAGGGEAAMEKALQNAVDELDLRPVVRWLGYRDEVADLYDLADVAVLTSRAEGTPLTLIEALGRGTPVVTFDVGGVRDLVEDLPHAAVVPPGNEEAFADALLRVMAERDGLRELARQWSGEVRRRFGAKRLVEDVAALYDELAGRR